MWSLRLESGIWWPKKAFTGELERLKTNHDNFCSRKKKILLFLAFFQLLSVLWAVQVGVYTLQLEPESFLMGCLVWKCMRSTSLHCGEWANAHRWQTWLSAYASLYLFNHTNAAFVHGKQRNSCSHVGTYKVEHKLLVLGGITFLWVPGSNNGLSISGRLYIQNKICVWGSW